MTIENQIEKMAIAISKMDDDIANIEDRLKKTKANKEAYIRELADLMAAEGFAVGSNIKLSNGRMLSIKDYFSASIPSQSAIEKEKDPEKMEELIFKRQACQKWLDENGLGSIIKNKFIIDLDRGDNERAKELMLELQEKDYDFVRDESVHHSTLTSTLKEEVKKGVNIPDFFGAQVGTTIKIK